MWPLRLIIYGVAICSTVLLLSIKQTTQFCILLKSDNEFFRCGSTQSGSLLIRSWSKVNQLHPLPSSLIISAKLHDFPIMWDHWWGIWLLINIQRKKRSGGERLTGEQWQKLWIKSKWWNKIKLLSKKALNNIHLSIGKANICFSQNVYFVYLWYAGVLSLTTQYPFPIFSFYWENDSVPTGLYVLCFHNYEPKTFLRKYGICKHLYYFAISCSWKNNMKV